jgi:hypothetical protein
MLLLISFLECLNLDAIFSDDFSSSVNTKSQHFTPYDPTQEPIFPPELKLSHSKYSSASIQFGKSVPVVRTVLSIFLYYITLGIQHN